MTVPPSKVVGVRVTPGVSNTSSTLTVTWQAPAEGNVTYTVKYSTQPGEVNTPPEGAFEVTGIGSNSTILTALKRGTTYYIWVMGVSEGGEGPHSDRMSRVTLDSELDRHWLYCTDFKHLSPSVTRILSTGLSIFEEVTEIFKHMTLVYICYIWHEFKGIFRRITECTGNPMDGILLRPKTNGDHLLKHIWVVV